MPDNRPPVGSTVALNKGSNSGFNPRVRVTGHDTESENGVWVTTGAGEMLYYWPNEFVPDSVEL